MAPARRINSLARPTRSKRPFGVAPRHGRPRRSARTRSRPADTPVMVPKPNGYWSLSIPFGTNERGRFHGISGGSRDRFTFRLFTSHLP